MTDIKNRLCPLPKNAYKNIYDKSNLCRHNFKGFRVIIIQIEQIQHVGM